MRREQDQAVFAYLRLKLFAYVLLGAAFAAGSTWLWMKGAAPPGSFKEFALMLGGPFFGLAAVVALVRAFGDQEVLTVDRQGILDKRISSSKLPWPMIAKLSVRTVRRQKFLMVELVPQFEATLQKTAMARLAAANAALGIKGMAISTHGLNGSLDELIEAIRRFSASEAHQLRWAHLTLRPRPPIPLRTSW